MGLCSVTWAQFIYVFTPHGFHGSMKEKTPVEYKTHQKHIYMLAVYNK